MAGSIRSFPHNAGGVLITFGIAAIVMGVSGFNTVRDSIEQEQIFFGSADDPAVAEHAEQWAEEQVTRATRLGRSPRSFARMRSSRPTA